MSAPLNRRAFIGGAAALVAAATVALPEPATATPTLYPISRRRYDYNGALEIMCTVPTGWTGDVQLMLAEDRDEDEGGVRKSDRLFLSVYAPEGSGDHSFSTFVDAEELDTLIHNLSALRDHALATGLLRRGQSPIAP